ncbi:transposase, partial [Flavobacterium rivuli]
RELLLSEKGLQKRKQRSADVEPVFAHLKHNNNFKRFTLKGLEKVELEFGLMALAHNLRKKIAA